MRSVSGRSRVHANLQKLVRVVILAGAGAALVLGQMSCAERTSSHTLTVPIERNLQTLDPALLSDPVSTKIVWQIYEGLVGLDSKNQVTPVLAESWKSEAGARRWVFQIRRRARFHESAVFTDPPHWRYLKADDVVYSYQRLAKGFGSFVFQNLVEGFPDFIQGKASEISGIRKTGEYEVTFTLTRPDPSFIYRITSPYLAIVPHELVDAHPEGLGLLAAVGTGPFQLINSSATEVTLSRNPHYYLPATGNVERIIYRAESNPQLRLQGFKSDLYNLLQVPTESRSQFFRGATMLPNLGDKYTPFICRTYNVHYLGFDCAALGDVFLRRAIALAVDAKQVESLLDGSGTLARGPVPPGMQNYESHETYPHDISQAKAELAKSTYRGETLTLLVSDTPNHSDVAQLIQQDLLKCGIVAKIEQTDFNTYVTRLFGVHRPQLFLGYSEWIYSAPEIVLEQFRSTAIPNPNVFGYSNVRVDSLLAALGTVIDRDSIETTCRAIESSVRKDPPGVWLCNEIQTYLGSKGIADFTVTGNNFWRLAEVRMGNGQ